MNDWASKASKPQRGAAFWRTLVRRWESSGLSQREVATAAGTSLATFQYWRAKLRRSEQSSVINALRADFIEVTPVSVAAEQQQGVLCRVRVGNHVVVELDALPPVDWLLALGRHQ
jgi:transposase